MVATMPLLSLPLLPALLVLTVLTMTGMSGEAATCPKTLVSSEAQTLLAAMDDLEDPQGVLEDWTAGNVSEACCWTGVTCLKVFGKKIFRVQSLVLSGLDLNGTLPSAFGNLTKLSSIGLSFNNFTGGIPESWAALSSLRDLRLGSNKLNGSLTGLAQLTSLETLDLSSNLFSQEMEAVPVGSLTKLTLLHLESNKFTGGFPTWLGNLSLLTELHLEYNPYLSPSLLPTDYASWPPQLAIASFRSMNLYGPLPAALAQLPLQDLDLSVNTFNGSIPTVFGNFTFVDGTILRLNDNNLTGEVPLALAEGSFFTLNLYENAFVGNISSFLKKLCGGPSAEVLDTLDLHSNQFVGEIPSEVQNCLNLGTLNLNENLLTGAIPPELGTLTLLGTLALENNLLSGEIPKEFSQLTSLTSLTFSNNNISGSLPQLNCSEGGGLSVQGDSNRLSGPLPSFSDCPLTVLSLHDNSLTGDLFVLANMSLLTNLSLSQNHFSGSLPAVKDWTALTTLDLSLNNFTARIPVSLGLNSPSLISINLSSNALTGDIPSTLFLSPTLLAIDLSYNNFTSPLDASFLNSTSLTTFYLQGNQISGPLPDRGLMVANSLLDLDLSDNLLSGPLPSNFSVVNSINSLKLGNNAFYGAIPPSLAELTTLVTLNLSKNAFNDSIPNLLSQNLKVLDLSENSFSGELPSFSGSSSLQYMDLSSNNISGSIPSNYSLFSSLQHLDLSDNDLSGSLPEGLGDLSSLTFIDLSNNLLSGPLPANLSRFNASSFSGNAGLCGALLASPCAATPPPPSPSAAGDDGLSGGAIGGIAVGAAAGLLLLAVGVCLFVWRNKRRSSEDEEQVEVRVDGAFSVSPQGVFRIFENARLSIDDIVQATGNFSSKHLLGTGGFGSVYKAAVSDDEVYAVKRLAQGSTQGDAEFRAEMETLGKVRHNHLVTLVASYNDPSANECLLIYNFLPGGNLDSLLKKGVDWSTRLNVAIGAARGLKYLHHDCIPYIIHRDMKPGNILMDEDMEAHVADFGLAKVVDLKKTHISTKLLGTIGYLAPEYATKGRASPKSDVFAFGVILLQLVSGKSPTHPQMRDGMSFWAKSTPKEEVIDSTLAEEEESRKEILAMLKLGIACTARKPMDRPTMEEVLHALEHLSAFAAGIKD